MDSAVLTNITFPRCLHCWVCQLLETIKWHVHEHMFTRPRVKNGSLWSFTALMPHIIVVFPTLTKAEPSAVEMEPRQKKNTDSRGEE